MHVCFRQGETLGEVKAGEEEVVSASDWVNRSRKKAVAMEEERLLAKQRERYYMRSTVTVTVTVTIFMLKSYHSITFLENRTADGTSNQEKEHPAAAGRNGMC